MAMEAFGGGLDLDHSIADVSITANIQGVLRPGCNYWAQQ